MVQHALDQHGKGGNGYLKLPGPYRIAQDQPLSTVDHQAGVRGVLPGDAEHVVHQRGRGAELRRSMVRIASRGSVPTGTSVVTWPITWLVAAASRSPLFSTCQ